MNYITLYNLISFGLKPPCKPHSIWAYCQFTPCQEYWLLTIAETVYTCCVCCILQTLSSGGALPSVMAKDIYNFTTMTINADL